MKPRTSRLTAAVEQAVASVRTIWEGEWDRASEAKIVGYTVGAKEWEALLAACREVTVDA